MSGNILDYIEWRGDIEFDRDMLNVVDALIFSTLAYLDFPNAEKGEAALKECYEFRKKLSGDGLYSGPDIMKKKVAELIKVAAKSRRFRNLPVVRFVDRHNEETEEQFSAASFILPGNRVFVAFRGTDNTLIGWKEDFNMAFTMGTPSQLSATEYLETIATDYPGAKLYVGGHSKGGNLAVWAATYVREEVQERIAYIFNNDGPGFMDKVTESDEYKAISDRILSLVPESSVIGLLLSGSDYLTIKSTALSVLQHNPFTWEVKGKGFVYEVNRTVSGNASDRFFDDVIGSMKPDELAEFVDRLYDELSREGEKTLNDLGSHLFRSTATVLQNLGRINWKKVITDSVNDDLMNLYKQVKNSDIMNRYTEEKEKLSITYRLFELQDKKYADFQAKLIPNVPRERIIGVRVPDCRKLAKDIFNDGNYGAFIKELPHRYMDEDLLHGLILSEYKDFDECLEAVDAFLPYVDNWAVCDIMSPKVFRKNKPVLIEKIKEWAASDHVYTCRFGMEMLMSHFLDEDFKPEYLDIPAAVRSEEYYVNMMTAWFFATALAKQWDATIPYITEHRLDEWTHNKSIQKARESRRITDEQKEYLKGLKI